MDGPRPRTVAFHHLLAESRNGASDLDPPGRERSETCGAAALVKQR